MHDFHRRTISDPKPLLTAKVQFKVAGASKGAVAAVEKAGGSVEVTAPAKAKAEASE